MSPAPRFVLPLLLLLAASRAAGQGETRAERRRELIEGTHVLRRILHDHDITTPLERYEQLAENPGETILVALGDLGVLSRVRPAVPGGLEGFVRRGGAVLLATDRAVPDDAAQGLRAVAGVSINRETYHHPHECYRGVSYCPRLRPSRFGDLGLLGDKGRDNRGELNVYTNLPSRLVQRREFPGGVRPQATLPPGSLAELPSGVLFGDFGQAPLFAVGGELGDGRVLVLADHSVFINQMMLPTDTNNVEFSYNVVRWLQGPGAKRTRVLFVEDGLVQTKLDIPLRSVSIPPAELLNLLFARRNQILAEAENVVARLEDDDAFNSRVFDSLGRSPEDLVMMLAVLGTLVGLLYLAYRLGVRARFRHDTTVPLLTAELGRVLPDEPLVSQRRQELLRAGDLREPAATMARRWFARLGIDPLGPEPAFEAAGGWWHRFRLVSRLRWLWRLAAGRAPSRVSPAELWRLQRELDGLSIAHQRGEWRAAGLVPAVRREARTAGTSPAAQANASLSPSSRRAV
jgi:hypothetical protein